MNKDASVASLEDVERVLRAELGDKYQMALNSCHSLLQVACRMKQVRGGGNQFVSGLDGKVYRLSPGGFVEKYPVALIPEEKRGFWRELLDKAW
jgi:hypothetical protein